MALSVIKRPQGYVLDTTQITGVTVASSSGALFTKTTHGLNTGDFIYIYSTFSSYNGFWYVNKNDANSFRIREYATASDQAFINSGGTITYYKSQLTHNWNCVHLPIVYKLKSTIWPTNGADTARSITSFSNYNGYTYINASGDIKTTGTASALEQVILSGCTNAGVSIDGVYKIIQWFSDTNFVINLAYSGSNVLSTGTVQYYYFNYHARIRIYAGIPAAHFWTAQKPYILMTEQRMIPDSSGIITLNVAQFIKSRLEIINNNSIKDTLPNNIDAWCNFYITYAESYDDSNMYVVSEFVDSYTDDSANTILLPPTSWTDSVAWTSKNSTQFIANAVGGPSDYRSYQPCVLEIGSSLSFNINLTITTGIAGVSFYLVDASLVQLSGTAGYTISVAGNYTVTLTNTGTASSVYLLIDGQDAGGVYNFTITLTDVGNTIIQGFNGYAANAKLPFKTQSQGALSKYVSGLTAATTQLWLTDFTRPTLFVGKYFDVSYIKNTSSSGDYIKRDLYRLTGGNYSLITSILDVQTDNDQGIYRYPLTQSVNLEDRIDITYYNSSNVQLSTTMTIDVNMKCSFTDFYLVWLNYLSGYNYWNFTAKRGKKYSIDVTQNTTQEQNIFNQWPNSYGEFADSIVKQTARKSKNLINISSQLLTTAQEDGIKTIVDSQLVQICTSQYDRQTLLVGADTLRIRQDRDKTLSLSLSLTYTDERPTQSL